MGWLDRSNFANRTRLNYEGPEGRVFTTALDDALLSSLALLSVPFYARCVPGGKGRKKGETAENERGGVEGSWEQRVSEIDSRIPRLAMVNARFFEEPSNVTSALRDDYQLTRPLVAINFQLQRLRPAATSALGQFQFADKKVHLSGDANATVHGCNENVVVNQTGGGFLAAKLVAGQRK